MEHKAVKTHATLTTSTNIFTPGSLWRAGTTTEQLTNYTKEQHQNFVYNCITFL